MNLSALGHGVQGGSVELKVFLPRWNFSALNTCFSRHWGHQSSELQDDNGNWVVRAQFWSLNHRDLCCMTCHWQPCSLTATAGKPNWINLEVVGFFLATNPCGLCIRCLREPCVFFNIPTYMIILLVNFSWRITNPNLLFLEFLSIVLSMFILDYLNT